MSNSTSNSTRAPFSIRRKLLVALAIPVLFVALVTGVQASTAQRNLNRTNDEVHLALVAGGPTTYITALLDERNITALHMLGLDKAIKLARVSSVAQARQAVDTEKAKFVHQIEASGGQVKDLFGPTVSKASDEIAAERKVVDDFHGPFAITGNTTAEKVYAAYSKAIARFHTANFAAVARINDARLHTAADSIAQQTLGSDYLSLMTRSAAMTQLSGGTVPQDEIVQAAQTYQTYLHARERAISDLNDEPKAQGVVKGFYYRPTMKYVYKHYETFLDTSKLSIPDVIALIKNAADVTYPNGTDAWNATRTALQTRGDAMVSSATHTRNTYLLLFVLATSLSIIFALLIARSISEPLIDVAAQADDMAQRRLPGVVNQILTTPTGEDIVVPQLDAITVASRDETSLVADSLNSVQDRTLGLAVEQASQRRNFAEVFHNIGQRVESLVSRQLDYITSLENKEEDPDTLSDLFELDHLATRVRRYSEALSVLAGSSQHVEDDTPISIADTIRASLSEVDDYQNVDIDRVDYAEMHMGDAAALSHILSELIENGLHFSDPGQKVSVTGRAVSGGYGIMVINHGEPMSDDDADAANRRLSGQESFTVAPSKYMGHFIAGHLAESIGVTVRVASSDRQTIASLGIPGELLVRHTAQDAEHDAIEPTSGEDTSSLRYALSANRRLAGRSAPDVH